MRKLNIGLIFGGKSGEHEVSLQSAKSIHEALDKNKYNVFLIGIDKKGKWILGNQSNYLLNSANPKLIKLNQSNQTPEITAIVSKQSTELINVNSGEPLGAIDVFFPVTHGTYGEDGSLQGFLELLNVAYVGAGVTGSALGMDKDVQKRLFKNAGIPTANFITFKKHQFTSLVLKEIINKLKLPVFVKPANLGSSVGVSKATNLSQLKEAVNTASQYDNKILIEEFIAGREIECSVLGNDKPIASVPGEILPQHEFYSYEAKYIDENGARLEIPAKLPKNKIKEIQQLAIKVFQTLECSGMARVDFFLQKSGEVVINEINTIPGFTKISMYPKLWQASGITYQELLDKLINLALDLKKQKDSLKRSFY